MADESSKLTLYQSDFPLIVGSISENQDIFEAGLPGLGLETPVNETRVAQGGAALNVEWATFASEEDRDAVIAYALTFTGGTTSEAPIEINAWDAVLAITTDTVLAIDHTTPPLGEGTYQVILNAQHRMQVETASQGSKLTLRIDRSDGAFYEQNDHTIMAFTQAVNLPMTFTALAGQTIRVRIGIALVTGNGGTAEVTGSRATIDKIA